MRLEGACRQIGRGSDTSIEDTVTINAGSLAKTMKQWKPLDVLYRANLVLWGDEDHVGLGATHRERRAHRLGPCPATVRPGHRGRQIAAALQS